MGLILCRGHMGTEEECSVSGLMMQRADTWKQFSSQRLLLGVQIMMSRQRPLHKLRSCKWVRNMKPRSMQSVLSVDIFVEKTELCAFSW
jgi:hypothetical protein